MKIFLDDVREPIDVRLRIFEKIGKKVDIYLTEWVIVSNYNDFKSIIKKNYKNITDISFDYDLGVGQYINTLEKDIISVSKPNNCISEDKTGYDCAVWMKDYYIKNKLKFPEIYVHSMNNENALKILNVFKK
jgi:hypothetical protein